MVICEFINKHPYVSSLDDLWNYNQGLTIQFSNKNAIYSKRHLNYKVNDLEYVLGISNGGDQELESSEKIERIKLLVNRYVDLLKEYIFQSTNTESEHFSAYLRMLIGRFREQLFESLDEDETGLFLYNLLIENDSDLVDNYISKLNMEFHLTPSVDDTSFWKHTCSSCFDKEQEATSQDLKDKSFNNHNYSHPSNEYKDDSFGNSSPELYFLTHDVSMRQDFNDTIKNWHKYNDELNNVFINHPDDEKIRRLISKINKTISSVILPGANTMHHIKSILKQPASFKKDQPVRSSDIVLLTSPVLECLYHMNYLTMTNNGGYILKPSLTLPKEARMKETKQNMSSIYNSYNELIEKRYNTVKKNLTAHYPRDNTKNLKFNVKNAMRLVYYIEMSAILKDTFRQGRINNNQSLTIENYNKMISDINKYLDNQKSGYQDLDIPNMKKLVFNDLFGIEKIHASNLLSTNLRKIENTFSVVLNNTNYNYASISTIKLIKDINKAFNTFIDNNQKLSEAISKQPVNSSNVDKNSLTSDINEYNQLSESLRKFAIIHPLNYGDKLLTETFNNLIIFQPNIP